MLHFVRMLWQSPESRRVPWSANSTTGTARTTAAGVGASEPGSAAGRPSIAKTTLRSTPRANATAWGHCTSMRLAH